MRLPVTEGKGSSCRVAALECSGLGPDPFYGRGSLLEMEHALATRTAPVLTELTI